MSHPTRQCRGKPYQVCKSPFKCSFLFLLVQQPPKLAKCTEYDTETQEVAGALICESCKDMCHGCHSSGSHQRGVLLTLQTQWQSCSAPPASLGACTGPGKGRTETTKTWSYPWRDSGLEGIWGDCPSGLLGLRGFLGLRTSKRKCQANA